jgi:hypothetical protein
MGHNQAESIWAWPTAVATCEWAGAEAARSGCHRRADVSEVKSKGDFVERAHDLDASVVAGAEGFGQLAEDAQVVPGIFQLAVVHGQLGPLQPVQRRPLVVREQQRPFDAAPGDIRVGGGFEVELDRLATGRSRRDRRLVVARVDALHRVLTVPEETLTPETHHPSVAKVDAGDDVLAGPGLRHGAAQAEPRRRPGAAPRLADAERLELAAIGLRGLDGLTADEVAGYLERRRLRIQEGKDDLPDQAPDPAPLDVTFVAHLCSFSGCPVRLWLPGRDDATTPPRRQSRPPVPPAGPTAIGWERSGELSRRS